MIIKGLGSFNGCVPRSCQTFDNQNVFVHRSETYGPVYRINFFHRVMLGVTCPETTKVKTSVHNRICTLSVAYANTLHNKWCKGA